MKQPAKHRTKTPPKVVDLLGQLAPQERAQLMHYLGCSRSTLWRYTQEPGKVPVNDAHTIALYLGAVFGDEYTIAELWNLTARQLGGRKATAA